MDQSKRPLLAIFLIVLVDVLGLTLILPLLPFYTEKYGGTPFVYGLLVASYAICQFISGPILGQISDRVGRKPLLLISQIGTFIGFLVLANAHSLFVIFISRIIDGATAGNLSLAQAYISDVTKPENRAKAFGLIGISFGLGFLVGPAISGFLSQFGYQYPAYAAAFLSFLSILGTTFMLPKVSSHQELQTSKKAKGILDILNFNQLITFFKNPALKNLLVQFFLFAFSFSMFFAGFALFSERRFLNFGKPFGPKEIGYLLAYAGLIGIIIQGGFIGRLVKKFGEKRLATFGFLFMGMGYALLGFSYNIYSLLAFITISSFGSSILRPSLTSLITQNAPRQEQGAVLGVTQSLHSIAQITAPLIAGYLITLQHLSVWAMAVGTVSLAAIAFNSKSLIAESRELQKERGDEPPNRFTNA